MCVLLSRTTSLKNNSVGDLNLSAIDSKVKDRVDLKRFHHITAVNRYTIAVATTHCNVTGSRSDRIKVKGDISIFAIMNRIIKSATEVNIVTKCGNYTVDNRILGLGVLNTTNDIRILTLNGLTDNDIGCSSLCCILIIGNGNAMFLTELNDVIGCADSILIG